MLMGDFMFRMSEFIFVVTILIILFVLIAFFSIRKTMKNVPVVVGASDCENTIECKLRKIIKSNPGCDIVVVDFGSRDDTLEIVKKLSFDYECIRIISVNEKNDGDIISKIIK